MRVSNPGSAVQRADSVSPQLTRRSSVGYANALSLILAPRRSCCAGRQRPRAASDGDELEGLTQEQLEALYAALLRLSALTPKEQATVLRGLLDGRV